MSKTFGQRPSGMIGLRGPSSLLFDFDAAVHWWGNKVEAAISSSKEPQDTLDEMIRDPVSTDPLKMTPIPDELFKYGMTVKI